MPWWSKKKPGDPLKIPAAAYNALLESLASRDNYQTGREDITRPAGLVKVKNNTGKALYRFEIVGIDSQLIPTEGPPTGNSFEFRSMPLFSGVVPRHPDHFGRFAVVQQPLQTGEVGWAMVSGVTPVRLGIRVGRTEATWADVEDGNTWRLEAFNAGSAKILWRVSGTATRWGVVNLGVPAVDIFWARITGASQISKNRWLYSFEEVTPADNGGWTTTYLGKSGNAHNTIETINDGEALEGAGWNVDLVSQQFSLCCLRRTLTLLPGQDRPCKLKPVPVGTVVAMRRDMYPSGSTWITTYRFQFVNPIECQEPSQSASGSAPSASSGSAPPGECQSIEVVTGVSFDPNDCTLSVTKQTIFYRAC